MKVLQQTCLDRQFRPQSVVDTQLLSHLQALPRHYFVPEPLDVFAYSDTALPVGHEGRTLWTPLEEAMMVSRMPMHACMQAVVVGGLNGYISALIAKHVDHVLTLECDVSMHEFAESRHHAMGVNNVTCEIRDDLLAFNEGEMFDLMIVTGSLPSLLVILRERMRVGGHVFAIVGQAPSMHAVHFHQPAMGVWECHVLFDTNRPRLPGVAIGTGFQF